MQKWKRVMVLASLPLSMLAVSCGDMGGGTNGSGKACTSDAACETTELCHPTAKVCVRKCTESKDCPTSAPTCSALANAPSSGKFCQCGTDANCGGGTGSTAICSTADKICQTKCGSNADCGGRFCDTATGQCKNDECSDTALAAQPGTCGYSKHCASNENQTQKVCKAAPEGTCTQATATGAPAWNKTAAKAPVIVSATATKLSTTNSTTECANGDPAALVKIDFYAPGGLTNHTDLVDLQKHAKFRTGTTFFGVNFRRGTVPANVNTGTLEVGIACGQASGTAALYLANEAGETSNVVCVTW